MFLQKSTVQSFSVLVACFFFFHMSAMDEEDMLTKADLTEVSLRPNDDPFKIQLIKWYCLQEKEDIVNLLLSKKKMTQRHLDALTSCLLNSVTRVTLVDENIRAISPLHDRYIAIKEINNDWMTYAIAHYYEYDREAKGYLLLDAFVISDQNYAWNNTDLVFQTAQPDNIGLIPFRKREKNIIQKSNYALPLCNASPNLCYMPHVKDGFLGVFAMETNGMYPTDECYMFPSQQYTKLPILYKKYLAWSKDGKFLFSPGDDRFKIVDMKTKATLFDDSIGNGLSINMDLSEWISDTTLLIVAESDEDNRTVLIMMKICEPKACPKRRLEFTCVAQEQERIKAVHHYYNCIVYYLNDCMKILNNEGRLIAQKSIEGSVRYVGPGLVQRVSAEESTTFEYQDFRKFFHMRHLVLNAISRYFGGRRIAKEKLLADGQARL